MSKNCASFIWPKIFHYSLLKHWYICNFQIDISQKTHCNTLKIKTFHENAHYGIWKKKNAMLVLNLISSCIIECSSGLTTSFFKASISLLHYLLNMNNTNVLPTHSNIISKRYFNLRRIFKNTFDHRAKSQVLVQNDIPQTIIK